MSSNGIFSYQKRLTSRKQRLYQPSPEVLVQQPTHKRLHNFINPTLYGTHLREVIDECDLGLCQMTHIRATNVQHFPPPLINLAGGSSPHDIIKQHISAEHL